MRWGIIIGIFATATTKGTGRSEYAGASLADFLALVANGIDIVQQNKLLKEFASHMKEAKKLKQEINEKIDKLIEQYSQLSSKHFS